jgi:hypothetical protein
VTGRPTSGAIAFMVDMPDGQTVATHVGGREGAVGSLSVLGPSRSSITATARVAGHIADFGRGCASCWFDGIGRGRAPHTAHVAYGSKSEELTMSTSFPLCPRIQTLPDAVGTSHLCQQQTHAPQQTASLFDHLVGPREQYRRKVDPRVPSKS